MFAIYACNKDKSKPRLPIAEHTLHNSEYDSCLFSIELIDSVLIISDYFTSRPVIDFDGLEQFICSEIQNNYINLMKDYPIELLIDSLTPYLLVDELIEELELIGFHAAYFKTANNGFFLVFPYKNDSIQYVVAELYGSRFADKRSIINDCKTKIQKNIYEEVMPPPPPPPHPLMSEYTYTRLYNPDSTLYPDLCLIEMVDNYFHINGKKVSSEAFKRSVYNKRVLFLKMSNSNTYNDMIKIIDAIEGIQYNKFEHFSQLNYKEKYLNLSKEQSMLIKRNFGFIYYIISKSEQIFYERLN